MMIDLEITSLVALFVAIIVGFYRKSNIGILAIGFSAILSIIYDIPAKTVIDGFSSSLAVMLIGITYLFGIVSNNGSLDIMAKKVVGMTGKHVFLIPIVIFLLGMLLCGIGPGAIPGLAIIPLLAVPTAIKSGYNPLLLTIIGQAGVAGARMSPLTPDAIVVQELIGKQDFVGNLSAISFSLFFTELILAIIVFIMFKGWKLKPVTENNKDNNSEEKIQLNHIISWVGVLLMIVLVLIFDVNVGLASFLIGTILIVLGMGSEKKAIQTIPWGVLLLVTGVGILMHVVVLSGGINVLTNVILVVMPPQLASAIMLTLSAALSIVSSSLGVTFPTLIPTCGPIALTLGTVDPVELVSVIVVGGTLAGFSPIATAGALAMSTVESETKGQYPIQKMFMQLLGIALGGVLLSVFFSLIGIYGFIVSII